MARLTDTSIKDTLAMNLPSVYKDNERRKFVFDERCVNADSTIYVSFGKDDLRLFTLGVFFDRENMSDELSEIVNTATRKDVNMGTFISYDTLIFGCYPQCDIKRLPVWKYKRILNNKLHKYAEWHGVNMDGMDVGRIYICRTEPKITDYIQ